LVELDSWWSENWRRTISVIDPLSRRIEASSVTLRTAHVILVDEKNAEVVDSVRGERTQGLAGQRDSDICFHVSLTASQMLLMSPS
jgi:hypothetical protein